MHAKTVMVSGTSTIETEILADAIIRDEQTIGSATQPRMPDAANTVQLLT